MVIEQQRISRLEGAYEQVDRRLEDMHQSINGLRAEMDGLRAEMHQSINGLRTEMNSRFEEVNSRFNTLIVLLAASWVTLIGVMTGLYFK
ncbi:MAG: hypothetical protein OXU67_11470 [Chloroflexota bacterium]|nr:hypothetical protein [Chloroflexota bacterium]